MPHEPGVPYLDNLHGKNITPSSTTLTVSRYGLPTYPYRLGPDGLLTIRQLRAKGLRPGGQDIAAQILWRHRKQRRVAYLYREDHAKPKRQATPRNSLPSAKRSKRAAPARPAAKRSRTASPAPGANATTAPTPGAADH